jgi:Sigma-70, region 4
MEHTNTEGVLGTSDPTAAHSPVQMTLIEVGESDPVKPGNLDEDELIATPRELQDAWSEAAARRAIGFRVREVLGEDGLDLRINPLPLETGARSFDWLCFGSQEEIDAWRSSDPLAAAVLASVEEWVEKRSTSFGDALSHCFDRIQLLEIVLKSCLDDRYLMVLTNRLRGETLEVIGSRLGLTRERVRQLEVSAENSVIDRLVALRSARHRPTRPFSPVQGGLHYASFCGRQRRAEHSRRA